MLAVYLFLFFADRAYGTISISYVTKCYVAKRYAVGGWRPKTVAKHKTAGNYRSGRPKARDFVSRRPQFCI